MATPGHGTWVRTAAGCALVLAVTGGWSAMGMAAGPNARSATYRISGQAVTLHDGRASSPAAPGSASRIVTTLVGNPARGSLGVRAPHATAVVLAQSTGGSGTFYYLTALLPRRGGAVAIATNAVFLGDRIRLQSLTISRRDVVVRYLTHAANAPMGLAPNKRVVARYRLAANRLLPVRPPRGKR